MAALQNVSNIKIIEETLTIRDSKKLGRIRPDEDGYYTQPLAVLGTATENNTYYDVNDFVEQITNKNSFLNKLLTDGKLHGEYGHPYILGMENNQALNRLLMIVEQNISHHFKSIWTGEQLSSGGVILYGKVKPVGPYGQSLHESLDDPCINTSFSLRSIAAEERRGNLLYRNIKRLVTFDAVVAGGYMEASKRFSPSVEALNISYADIFNDTNEIAVESMSSEELCDIFDAKRVTIDKQVQTFNKINQTTVDNNGEIRSPYHDLIKLL